jgi:hypothetical protein
MVGFPAKKSPQPEIIGIESDKKPQQNSLMKDPKTPLTSDLPQAFIIFPENQQRCL